MKTNEDNYYPIKFALNRAVFHKELTVEKADNGLAQYDALIDVENAARAIRISGLNADTAEMLIDSLEASDKLRSTDKT